MAEQRWTSPAYNYSSQHPSARVVIKSGFEGAGRRGWIIGSTLELYEIGNIKWVPVLWDDEEDPDWFKASGLRVQAWQDFNSDTASSSPAKGEA